MLCRTRVIHSWSSNTFPACCLPTFSIEESVKLGACIVGLATTEIYRGTTVRYFQATTASYFALLAVSHQVSDLVDPTPLTQSSWNKTRVDWDMPRTILDASLTTHAQCSPSEARASSYLSRYCSIMCRTTHEYVHTLTYRVQVICGSRIELVQYAMRVHGTTYRHTIPWVVYTREEHALICGVVLSAWRGILL